jgi:shikimate dehydrogenase
VLDLLDGETRVHFIVGDPIAQVKSPAGATEAFRQRGHNTVVLPAHVAPAHLSSWHAGVSHAQNVDGIIVTVPHKFAAFGLCSSASERATFLRTVNTMRRNADGSWHGDMFDGLAFVEAMRDAGFDMRGKRALLVGAGGAGSAIAHALLIAGVSALAIADTSKLRRTTLIDRLNWLKLALVTHGSTDPTGYDIVLNATPMGMKERDPYPTDVTKLNASMFVGCVITEPVVSPTIAAARAQGCATVTGAEMFGRVRDLMVDFLLEPSAVRRT